MDITIIPASEDMPVQRRHVISVTIRTFKGRRNVELLLFRTGYDDSELAPLRGLPLIGSAIDPAAPGDPDDALRTVLEAFTEEERDAVIAYLEKRYDHSITSLIACPLELPIPLGVSPLSAIPEGRTMGFVRFECAPSYPLGFCFRGFYDLDQHEPLVSEHS